MRKVHKCANCGADTRNPVYCCSSCAASYNNVLRRKIERHRCVDCGKEVVFSGFKVSLEERE